MTLILAGVLVTLNLGLIFLLFAVPLGVRTVRQSRVIAANRAHIWSAVWPFGENAGWSGQHLRAEALAEPGLVRIELGWEGRDGKRIEHIVRLEDVVDGKGFSTRVIDDSSLELRLLVALPRQCRTRRRGRRRPRHALAHRPLPRRGLPALPLLRAAP